MLFKEFFARAFALLAVAAMAFAPLPLSASRVSPMIIDLEPTGRSSIGRVELTNDADRDIAYEVQMMRGDISPAGELTLTPADEDFLVFPPQVVVEANSQQVFRVQFVGDQALDASRIYYLAVRQIPVAFEEGRNAVQVVVNFNVLVNVVPPGTEPAPFMSKAEYVEREMQVDDLPEGEEPPIEKGLLIELGNQGTAYYFASEADWLITGQTTAGSPFELELSGPNLSRYTGVGVVGPGNFRQFFIPTEEPLVSESVRVKIEL